MNTKPIVRMINTQIESLKEEDQAAKQAYEEASARRAKQIALLEEICHAAECEGLDAAGIRARAMIRAGKKEP
jgi:hypothetical protein